MSIIHRLETCGWQVAHARQGGPDGEIAQTDLMIVHPGSDQIWVIPMPPKVAHDMGAQLQGEPPKKHIDLPGENGVLPPSLLQNGQG